MNGVCQDLYFQSDQVTYSFKNQTDKPRVVYVEHPVRQGWELDKNGPTPAFTTARYYRFRVELPPYEKRELLSPNAVRWSRLTRSPTSIATRSISS